MRAFCIFFGVSLAAACASQPRLRTDKLPGRGLDCPHDPPAEGAACPARAVAQTCWYGELPRCPVATCASANGGYAWSTSTNGCPMDCPGNAPSDGDTCRDDAFQTCSYDAHGVFEEHASGCGRSSASCAHGRWTVTTIRCEGT